MNEFTDVPVFRPDADAVNPDWQQLVDDCHPLLRTVALAGVSAVQEGVRHSDELREPLLDVVLSDAPLLEAGDETSSPMFGPIHTDERGFTRFTHELPAGQMLVVHGLYIANLARRLSRVARVESKQFAVPVARDEQQQAEPGYVSQSGHRRLYDMYANPYFEGRPLRGILAGHLIKTVDINITDTHATDPSSPAAATTIDMTPRYNSPDGGGITGLFSTLGVEISGEGLVRAITDNGVEQPGENGTERSPYRLTSFEDLGRYAEYFARFPLR